MSHIDPVLVTVEVEGCGLTQRLVETRVLRTGIRDRNEADFRRDDIVGLFVETGLFQGLHHYALRFRSSDSVCACGKKSRKFNYNFKLNRVRW